jgi:hypothetical protein
MAGTATNIRIPETVNNYGLWQIVFEQLRAIVVDLETLRADIALLNTRVNLLRTNRLAGLHSGNPAFVIDTNFDVKNTNAFQIVSGGLVVNVAANTSWDTGTAESVDAAKFAAGLLSIDVDGSTTYIDWAATGTGSATEAAAIALLGAVSASGDVVVGYVVIEAHASNSWTAGTDALTSGTGGNVANSTSYYQHIDPDALIFGSALTTTNTDAAGDLTASSLTPVYDT